MKLAITGLFLCAAVLSGCVGTMGDGLNRAERAGIVRADSGCDNASAVDHRDPSSPCFISRRGRE